MIFTETPLKGAFLKPPPWASTRGSRTDHQPVRDKPPRHLRSQTLQDDTEVFYQMSAPYAPEANTGVRWNDPVFGLRWPLAVTEVSERDRTFPDFRPPGPFGPR